MYFGTGDGDQWQLSLRYPREDLTPAEVETAMQNLISSGAFVNGILDVLAADIVDRTVTELIGSE
jgi:hypothetical protein